MWIFFGICPSSRWLKAILQGGPLRSGLISWLSDPENQFYGVNILGYNSSKSALNVVTVAFAKELTSFGIRVNAADPGYTATDFNSHSGYRTVQAAASGIVWLATQGASGPTGKVYFEQAEVLGDELKRPLRSTY